MIEIKKPVFRRTRRAYSVPHQQPKQIVVGIAPGDILTFRASKSRTVWSLPVDVAFRFAITHPGKVRA